jgi:hypothetical protein
VTRYQEIEGIFNFLYNNDIVNIEDKRKAFSHGVAWADLNPKDKITIPISDILTDKMVNELKSALEDIATTLVPNPADRARLGLSRFKDLVSKKV